MNTGGGRELASGPPPVVIPVEVGIHFASAPERRASAMDSIVRWNDGVHAARSLFRVPALHADDSGSFRRPD